MDTTITERIRLNGGYFTRADATVAGIDDVVIQRLASATNLPRCYTVRSCCSARLESC
jgi:hypothetical protein